MKLFLAFLVVIAVTAALQRNQRFRGYQPRQAGKSKAISLGLLESMAEERKVQRQAKEVPLATQMRRLKMRRGNYRTQLCQWTNKGLRCNPLNGQFKNITFPTNKCRKNNPCDSCKVTFDLFIIQNSRLIPIGPQLHTYVHEDSIVTTPQGKENKSLNAIICMYPDETPCNCQPNCLGSRAACTYIGNETCTVNNKRRLSEVDCYCKLSPMRTKLLTKQHDKIVSSPDILKVPVCLYNLTNLLPTKNQAKRIAIVSPIYNNNINLEIIGTAVQVDVSGTLIFRKDGLTMTQLVKNITEKTLIDIPPEFFIHTGLLEITFAPSTGGIRMIEHYTREQDSPNCLKLTCIFCIDLFSHIDCLPTNTKYLIYGIMSLIIVILLYYLTTIIRFIIMLIVFVCMSCNYVFRGIKNFIRFNLLVGTAFGLNARKHTYNWHAKFKNYVRLDQINAMTIICFIFLLSLALGCNEVLVEESTLKQCETLEGKMSCLLEKTVELNLLNLGFTQCLTLKKNDRPLLHLAIKYDSLTCDWLTNRMYYTAPFNYKVISQHACSYNKYCGAGTHCYDEYPFELQRQLNYSHSGYSRCFDSIKHGLFDYIGSLSSSCLFVRYYILPNYKKTYEVRSPIELNCHPKVTIQITNAMNEKMIVPISISKEIRKDLSVQILGLFQLPIPVLNRQFIRNVKTGHTYLTSASEVNAPLVSTIGEI